MATENQSEGVKIIDTIESYGLPRSVGWQLAFQILPKWTANEIANVLDRVEGIEDGFASLKTVQRNPSYTDPRSWRWIKPPWELMANAAREKKALCVNAQGDFALLEHNFFAISHAGIEGLFEDESNRGLPHSIIRQLFTLVEPLNAQWLWIDSLAIPAGRRDLNVAEERLKNELINMMAHIYGEATTVIALDALVIHLVSDDPVDIAVALLCGRWMRRLWTYQEGRLAKHLTILTKNGSITMTDLIESLKTHPLAQRADEMIQVLSIMLRSRENPHLQEIATNFFSREAGLLIDYARALFPVLKLNWDNRFTRDQAMTKVFNAHRSEATQLVCSWGPPRLIDGPGWAPAVMTGMRLHPISNTKWTSKGLESDWYLYNIQSVGRHETNKLSLHLEFDHGTPDHYNCWAFSSNDEREESRQIFVDRVASGQGVLLAHEPLEPMKFDKFLGRYRIVLLAAKMPDEHSQIFQVCLTAQIFWLDMIELGTKTRLTLSHLSPLYRPSAADESKTTLLQAFTTDLPSVPSDGTRIHHLVRQSDINGLRGMLDTNQRTKVDINAYDTENWTALHWAVVSREKNSFEITKVLLEHGAEVNSGGKEIKSPLVLAIEFAKDEVIELLLEKGASMERTRGVTPFAQAVFVRRSLRILELLLSHGAKINESVCGLSPLWLVHAEDVPFLLEKGADPSAKNQEGKSYLHHAAYRDQPEILKLLVKHGVAVDTVEKSSGFTPLCYALEQQNVASVRELLLLQANANFRTESGWPLVVGAAAGVSLDILQAFLEAGAKADVFTSDESWTPLHTAVTEGRFANLNLLLEQSDSKFSVWRKDKDNMTARDLAVKLRKKDMVTLLQRRMKQDAPKTAAVEGSDIIAMLYMVLSFIATFHYSACGTPKYIEEPIWRYWFRQVFSTDFLPLKFMLGLICVGLIFNKADRKRSVPQSLADTLNRNWTNKPDSNWARALGFLVLGGYAFGVWYFGSPLESNIGLGIFFMANVMILIAYWERDNKTDDHPGSLQFLAGYLWLGAAAPYVVDYMGVWALTAITLSIIPTVLGVYSLGGDDADGRENFVKSRKGIALGLAFHIIISILMYFLGWELLAITAMLVLNMYFALRLLQDFYISIPKPKYFNPNLVLLGSFTVSIMLTYISASLVLDCLSGLFLIITSRDIWIASIYFAANRLQTARRGNELRLELTVVAGSWVRITEALQRMFARDTTIIYLFVFTVGVVLLWSRRKQANRFKGENVAPYVLVVGVAWIGFAVWSAWLLWYARETILFSGALVLGSGGCLLARVGEKKKKRRLVIEGSSE